MNIVNGEELRNYPEGTIYNCLYGYELDGLYKILEHREFNFIYLNLLAPDTFDFADLINQVENNELSYLANETHREVYNKANRYCIWTTKEIEYLKGNL